MAAINKTEVISAADFQASKGQKAAVAKPGKRTVFPVTGTGAVYELTYSGEGLSSNKWYSGIPWHQRVVLKKTWRDKFHPLIVAAQIQHMERFRVSLRYRSRLDADNTTAMLKFLIDSLKGWFVPDDSPKYFKGFSVEYDDSLAHNTYIFTVTQLP